MISRETAIHNRLEIFAELGLAEEASDCDLLIAGWRRWGRSLPDRLRGSFAFVIFDHAANSVHAARDIFGLAPLYYEIADERAVFTDSSADLRAHSGHDHSPDLVTLADFTQGVFIDKAASFFEGVKRLPSAHWLEYDGRQIKIERYWSPYNQPQLTSCPDAPEQFRALFDRSVQRAVGDSDCALTLSGGLDSSAILGSLSVLDGALGTTRFLTQSFRESESWNDDAHLAALQHQFDLQIREVPSDRYDPWQDMDRWLGALDGPYVSYNTSLASSLHVLAHDAGCDTILTGHGGDEIVGYGLGRLNELARAGLWWRLGREIPAASALWGYKQADLWRLFGSHSRPFRGVMRLLPKNRSKTNGTDADPALNAELAEMVGAERYDQTPAFRRRDHDDRMLHAEAIDGPVQSLSLESQALIGRAIGVTTQMPFYDRDLVEFTLSLPSDWRLRNRETRYVLRRAMAGRLPAKVMARRTKFDFSNVFIANVMANRELALDWTAPRKGDLDAIVNRDRLNHVRERLSRNETPMAKDDAFFLWRSTVLAMWLSQSGPLPEQSPWPLLKPAGLAA